MTLTISEQVFLQTLAVNNSTYMNNTLAVSKGVNQDTTVLPYSLCYLFQSTPKLVSANLTQHTLTPNLTPNTQLMLSLFKTHQ